LRSRLAAAAACIHTLFVYLSQKSNRRGTCRESRAGWLRDSLLPAARQIGDWGGSTARQEDAEEATRPHGNGMRVDVQPHAIGLGQRAHCVALARLDERMRVEWTTLPSRSNLTHASVSVSALTGTARLDLTWRCGHTHTCLALDSHRPPMSFFIL
jgi:hypothetical protein